MLRGHPFTTKERFTRGFSFPPVKNRSSDSAEPGVIALQRFLLAIVVARPSSSLELPGIQLKDAIFELDDTEKNLVLEYTTKTKGNTGHVDIGEALGFAVRAQLYAAHNMLCEQPTSSDEAMPSIEIEDEPEI
ncbi:hypothetical protein IFM46972_03346 [Aspergillus udagawae]|uniref:Uncharacterized protein n=1 Tax=Aspergillus udagawae TaxID=91492 RepID=A0A8H3ND15_9EURO|nr:hypothetical protein IFM46972_03346 [Aspergillus udagawae]